MKKLIAMTMLGVTLMPALGRADLNWKVETRNDRRGGWGHDRDRRDGRDRDRRDHDRREHDRRHPVRHRGSWHHGHHNGHLGWWFVLAGAWYAVNRAAYEAQAEPVVVEQPVTVITPPSYTYYCRSSNSYYPYVSSCTEGWQQVTATPVQVN